MKLRIMRKCNCGFEHCEAIDYFIFRSKWFQFRFFDDYGHKFLYMHIGEKHWRWDW